MAYTKYYSGGWQNASSGNTPITAAALNHIEQGIIDASSVPQNYEYGGANLKTVFGSAASLHSAVNSGDFSKIRVGDYYPITLSGSFYDYADSETKNLSSAVMNFEVASINGYWKYGDSGGLRSGANHLIMCPRDCLPVALKYRATNAGYYDASAPGPWQGSAVRESLNNSTNGLVVLMLASELGNYIYTGPNSAGMRARMELKEQYTDSVTDTGWGDRGILFLPTESEVVGAAHRGSAIGQADLSMQWPLFMGSLRHVRKGSGNGGASIGWWTGTSVEGTQNTIVAIASTGMVTNPGATNATVSVAPCFILV